MDHVLQSEKSMPVERLLSLEDSPDGLQVLVRWKILENSKDSLEPLKNFYEDVPLMVDRLLKRKTIPMSLISKARAALAL